MSLLLRGTVGWTLTASVGQLILARGGTSRDGGNFENESANPDEPERVSLLLIVALFCSKFKKR
jgi:hypothetical protein